MADKVWCDRCEKHVPVDKNGKPAAHLRKDEFNIGNMVCR